MIDAFLKAMLFIQKNFAWLIAAALAISLYLINEYRKRKAFSFQILTNTPIVTQRPETIGKVKILFNDKPAHGVRLVEVALRNSGAVQINPGDFEVPVALVFPSDSEILEAEVKTSSPERFKPVIATDGVKVTLVSALMNQGDNLIIKCLVSGFGGKDPDIEGRIAGVKDISEYSPDDIKDHVVAAWCYSGILASSLGGGAACYHLVTLIQSAGFKNRVLSEEIMTVFLFAVACFFSVAIGKILGTFRYSRQLYKKMRKV